MTATEETANGPIRHALLASWTGGRYFGGQGCVDCGRRAEAVRGLDGLIAVLESQSAGTDKPTTGAKEG